MLRPEGSTRLIVLMPLEIGVSNIMLLTRFQNMEVGTPKQEDEKTKSYFLLDLNIRWQPMHEKRKHEQKRTE